MSIGELGLPPVIARLAEQPRGLVLVTGPTGSGKTTTLAAMIDHVNANRAVHIVTIEDPIEVLHADKLGMVSQREVRVDTDDFTIAMRAAMRQDPDVILVGGRPGGHGQHGQNRRSHRPPQPGAGRLAVLAGGGGRQRGRALPGARSRASSTSGVWPGRRVARWAGSGPTESAESS